MKKQFTKSISKKAFTVLLAALISCGISQKSFALPKKSSIKGADITFKGVQNKRLVFNVSYKNEVLQPFQLIVKNGENEILFSKQYDANPLNTSMLFTEIPENGKLAFIIRTGKKEVAEAFQIKTQSKTVEEYIVKGM